MISKDKTYRTRDGREVRIYATDGHPLEPIHGAFQDYSGAWNSTMWRHDGTNVYGKGETDLIEVKPRIKRTVWMNVYDNEVIHGGWRTKEEAQGYHEKNRIACLKLDLDFEEGEGL
ncbi:MAG: hypothetical protein AMJ56_00555 [Anaerolineae bacterium SG8_19]|nr:MAG: hypothetical protein AMJ56_00555 [Anaerolineae bacterium SG8_19]